MKNNKKIDNITQWYIDIIIEAKSHAYKFKINNKWVLDPFRRLQEDGIFQNHIFLPTNKEREDALS